MERAINNKTDFVRAVRRFVATEGKDTPDGCGRIGYRPQRGELTLMAGIADCFEQNTSIIEGDAHDNWLHYLPEWLDETFEEIRTSKKHMSLRERFLWETERAGRGESFPSLVDFHIGGLGRLLTVKQLTRLIPILAYPEAAKTERFTWLNEHLESYVFAQDRAVEQAWHRFVRGPYRKLLPRIKDESHRGNKGTFGKTTLMSYAIAGRVMFTFERPDPRGGRRDPRDQVSFVADDGDMFGHRSGGNSTTTPFTTCIEMIHDVVDHWDIDKFAEDGKVGLG